MSEEKPPKRQIVLCFDGTGNTFRADGADTNILKIYRMLEKDDSILSYYQPGIGTDITPGSLASTTLKHSSRLGKSKTISQAFGKSFEKHVLGGYRFLMRHYQEDTELYIFGFSRGAYTACYLAQMLDYTGLLGPDNEEMIPFIWKAFADFKLVRFKTESEKKLEAFRFMKACRETLTRPTPRISFLGVFDTVNSVADFEVDNNFTSTARFIRHAVSIDERRVKFQPVLLQTRPAWVRDPEQRRRRLERHKQIHQRIQEAKPDSSNSEPAAPPPETTHCQELENAASEEKSVPVQSQESQNGKADDVQNKERANDESDNDEDDPTDELEVWFPGCHSDVGGGNKPGDEKWQLSHAPLVWMCQEASKAGLRFDWRRLKQYDCLDSEKDVEHRNYLYALHHSSATGILNDSLKSALAWNILEYIPVRHVEVQDDGSWATMHWPLHKGKPRGIPWDAMVHVSAIRRMQHNKDYRPGNLIVGEGGRGVIKAPPEYGIGDWVPKYNIGVPSRELYVRKTAQQQDE